MSQFPIVPDEDCIAAIATAPGQAGIAVVRVSGPGCLAIADRLIRHAGPPPSQRAGGSFLHGYIHTPDADLDEVIVLIYRAPHSYTRQDVFEIQCHGGRISARRILRLLIENGARPADPGEFTKRAFLNGRIDLLQAEAVMDLVNAQSDRAATAALLQMEGRLTDSLSTCYNSLVALASDMEASLDFDETDLPVPETGVLVESLRQKAGVCRELLDAWEEGHLLRDGATVVIAGRPNVGKSTLMNALLGRSRSIVADTPGTTRDTIEELLVLEGVPLRITDTAGLRQTDCEIEQAGVERAEQRIEQADLLLYLVDASLPFQPEDLARVQSLTRPALVVLNKSDLGQQTGPDAFPGFECVGVSLVQDPDASVVRSALATRLDRIVQGPPHAVISERHRHIIQLVLSAINDAIDILSNTGEQGILLASPALRRAAEHLGNLLGKTYSEDILDSIFSRFCIGK
jgi:tRNA modification GTPase